MPNYTTEIAIVGGGVCGLWLLNLLRDKGYEAVLFERDQLGSAQTHASQGMIHGGIKYTLGGFTTEASETIANMPGVWRNCIEGTGPINLKGLDILSEDYYLFSDGALSSRITAFFASKSLRGRVDPIRPNDYPEAFQNPAFKGQLYKLQDIVVDAGALTETLRSRYPEAIYQGEAKIDVASGHPNLIIDGNVTISASRYILAAGEGNGPLATSLPGGPVAMQTRPLKQVMVKGALPSIYAHAVSLKDAAKPRLTITTHAMADGDKVWYLGGNLAEQGVAMTNEAVIEKAKAELKALLPWIDTTHLEYRTLDINRAEPHQKSGSRPDNPYVQVSGQVMTCWPTKLTLTPLLGNEVLDNLPAPSGQNFDAIQLPLATVAPFPWQEAFA